MFTKTEIKDYQQLHKMLDALIKDDTNVTSILANASSLLNYYLDDVNWVGFYLFNISTDRLELGPFQGLPACTTIEVGKGVCGLSYKGNDVFIVDDVTAFPGHIACDANSRSEIVVPIYKDGVGIGVLDVDSPSFDRFNQEDRDGLMEFVEIVKRYI